MKPVDVRRLRAHILVCANERPHPEACCRKVQGEELYLAFKARLLREGLAATHWATRTGCLGFCNWEGTTVVIQPAGKPAQWYTEVTLADFETLWSEIVRH